MMQRVSPRASTDSKPFQGLKRASGLGGTIVFQAGFNRLKTLSGIEASDRCHIINV